jgi:hypothetical protein
MAVAVAAFTSREGAGLVKEGREGRKSPDCGSVSIDCRGMSGSITYGFRQCFCSVMYNQAS